MAKKTIDVKDLCIKYKEYKKIHAKNFFKNDNISHEFVALQNITFSVLQGDVLGIVGKNGAGKSTLLRAIAGIYSPDSGSVTTFDNSVSLLSLKTGFSNDLTGRDNILLIGTLMGKGLQDIKNRMEDIIEFSELGDFIDKQVRTYSSGMKSRLAFSISSIMEPDILLIDEVLSVGDMAFKRKSYNQLKPLITKKDKTTVIVSHNIETLRNLCTKTLWLENGKIKMVGLTEDVLEQYEESMS